MAFIAAAAPLLGTLGSIVGAAGTLAGGLYAGQVASNNAQVARQNADYAKQAGQVDASNQSMKGAVKSARIKTGFAANGIDVNSGSAVDVAASQAAENEMDVDTVLHNADLRAYGYTTQATNFDEEATQDRVGAVLGATGSLLSKAPSLSMKWGNAPAAADDEAAWAG